MTEICQTQLPEDMRILRKLPGIQPLNPSDWLHVDEAYAGQMARRRAVLSAYRDVVLAQQTNSSAAAEELLEMVLQVLDGRDDFRVSADDVICPDGAAIALDSDPLYILGQLVQEDFCILYKPEGEQEHVLGAAVLCFPASWLLSEKIGKPLMGVHAPVKEYDDNLGKRVQRLFDGVQAGKPLWRFNRLWYADPELYQPRGENERRAEAGKKDGGFLRSERQCILRLPRTNAVVFSIHTYVLRREVVLPQLQ